MAGKDESARLQGMLSEIAGTVGEMGAGRDWGANAIRQIARPDNQAMFRGEEFKLDNSANLMKMAQWAERNGYDDEAKRYMALGASQQKTEGKKAYADELAVGTEKLRGLYGQLAKVKATPNADANAITALEAQISTVESNLNEAGASNIYGVANAGSLAGQTVSAEMLAAERAALEGRKLEQDVLEGEAAIAERAQKGQPLTRSDLPYLGDRFDAYTQAVQTASLRGDAAVAVENEKWLRINKELGETVKNENKTIANGQVQVIHQNLIKDGKSFINDDDLSDFLEEDLTTESKQAIDEIIISKAITDSDWIEGDADAQRQVIAKHFIDQYSRHFREDFGQGLAERQAGKTLSKSDAIADYKPNMNPDYTAEEGGGKEQFEAWYENAVTQDPSFTREEARQMWDEEHKLTASGGPKMYRREPGLPIISDAYDKAESNYSRFQENMAKRRAENAKR
jgi:hypothetical protein